MTGKTFRTVFLFVFSIFYVYFLAINYSVFESNNGMGPAFVSGALTGGEPVSIFYFTSHFLLVEAYMFLYRLVPMVPWYELCLYFYVALSLFITLQLLWLWFGNNFKFWIVPALVSCIIFTEPLYFMEYTRMAFALGTASVLLMILNKDNSPSYLFLSVLCFLLCLLTRPEVGVLIIITQWMLHVFMRDGHFPPKIVWTNSILVFFVMGVIVIDRISTDSVIKQFEPELGYQLLDRGNVVPLGNMKTAVDSAKYIAALNMITDPDYVSIDFLRGLIGEDPFVGIDKKLLERTFEILGESAKNALGLLFIYSGILIVMLWQKINSSKKALLKFLGFTISFWMLIIVTIYFIKMERWVFNSVVGMMSLILLCKINYRSIHGYQLLPLLMAGLMVCVGTVKLFEEQQDYSQAIRNETLANSEFKKQIERKYSGRIIMPGLHQAQLMINSSFPFDVPDFSSFKKIYLFDSDVLYLVENYNAYLRANCNCNAGNYVDFMDFLVTQKKELVVISNEERTDLMTYYCSTVRKENYLFTPIDSVISSREVSIAYTLDKK